MAVSFATGKKKADSILKKAKAILRAQGILIALIIIWIVLSISNKYFLTYDNITNILLQSATLLIAAVGMTFIIITGEIDLSMDAVLALTGCIAAILMIRYSMNPVLAILISMAIGTFAGFISGYLMARFKMAGFIATLGISNIYRGLALILTTGVAIFGLPESMVFLGQGRFLGIPVPVIIALIVWSIGYILLNYTKFGINCYAVGGSPEAAELAGISVGKTRFYAMVLGSFLGSLAGVITTARLNAAHGLIANGDLMMYIAAVVIGGTAMSGGIGTLKGTLIGALIIGTIRNGLNLMNVSSFWQLVALGLIVIGAVMTERIASQKRGNL